MIRVLTEVSLPPEVLSLVFTKLGRVRNIHCIKRTCRAFRDAAERAVQAHRRVCFEEHTKSVESVALAADGRVLTASGKAVKVWRADDGASERTIEVTGHRRIIGIIAVAALPGGAYFVSASWDHTVKLWTLDGALERTFDVRGAECVAALQTACTLWSDAEMRSGCTTSTARWSTPSRGTRATCMRWR